MTRLDVISQALTAQQICTSLAANETLDLPPELQALVLALARQEPARPHDDAAASADGEDRGGFQYGSLAGQRCFSFGAFRLLPNQRLLLKGETRLRMGGRAFDVLTALVERAGEVVGKSELIARVWRKISVEEANLKVQICTLRRALGDDQEGRRFIATIPARGYAFVAPVRLDQETPAGVSDTNGPSR